MRAKADCRHAPGSSGVAGSPSRRKFSGSNTNELTISASIAPSTSGARTRCPIRSRPPFTSASANVRPERGTPIRRRDVAQHRDRRDTEVGVGDDQLGAFGKEPVGVERQQADQLLPVRPTGIGALCATAGR